MSSHVADLNTGNQILIAKPLKQGYRYHKLRKTFSKFHRRHYDLVSKFNTGLKYLLKQSLSEPEFYSDLVYKFKKIVCRNDFSDQFWKVIIRSKRIGYNMNVMRQTACLMVNPITVNNFADLFICTPVGRTSDLMMAPAFSFQFSWLGPDDLSFVGPTGASVGLLLLQRWTTVGLLFLQRFRVGLLLSTRLVSSQWWLLIYIFAVLIHW